MSILATTPRTAAAVGARVSYLSALHDRIEDATGWMRAWAIMLADEAVDAGAPTPGTVRRYWAARCNRALAEHLYDLERRAPVSK